MTNITINNFNQVELDEILKPAERLLWTGKPNFGVKFFEAVGAERTIHSTAIVGIVVMWSTIFFIDPHLRFGQNEALWIYSAFTLAFLGALLFIANERQYVLSHTAYFVTDERAMVCRRARNWRLISRLYVVSCWHSDTYPYSLIASRPFPSVQIGTLLSVDQVQPFGTGLSHPGHSMFAHRTSSPVSFDYISDAQEVLELILLSARSD